MTKKKIALLTADVKNPRPNIGDFFITHGIETLLKQHSLTRIPLHESPSSETLSLLEDQDLLILCGSNLIGGNAEGGFRSSFTLEQLQKINKPVLGLGLGVQKDFNALLKLSEKDRSFLEWISQSTKGISARDSLTFEILKTLVPSSPIYLTGCPSLFAKANETKRNPNLKLFCAPPYHYQTEEIHHKTLFQLSKKLLKSYPSTLLVQEPSDLRWNLFAPGVNTFYHPLNPCSHLDLIAAADQILSFRIHPVLMGVNHGVPSVLIALDERTQALAEYYQIPFYRYSKNASASEILSWYQQTLSKYPWERIREKLQTSKKEIKNFLELNDTPEKELNPSNETLSIACLSDTEYFPQFLGLCENLKKICPETKLEFHLLWLEPSAPIPSLKIEGITVIFYSLSEIWPARIPLFATSKSIIAYISKAEFLRKLVSKLNKPVLFSDIDIYYFHSPLPLVQKTDYALLFPHWNDQLGQNRTHGIFNSGMLVVTEKAIHFLEWWSRLCQRVCEKNIQEGYYYEQGFLDMALLYFPEIEIHRDYRDNCGVWNVKSFGQRIEQLTPWSPETKDGPMHSYHATHPDPTGFFTYKVLEDQKAILINSQPSTSHLHTWILFSVAKYWPETKRLVFVYETLVYRFQISLPNISEKWSHFFTLGKGEWILRGLTYLYWVGRDVKNFFSNALQKRALLKNVILESEFKSADTLN